MAHPKRRFCLRGHDTWATGRTPHNTCRGCERDRNRANRRAAGIPQRRVSEFRERQTLGVKSLNHEYIDAAPLLEVLKREGPVPMPKWVDKAVWRARDRGTFTINAADELCIRVLGVHPIDVFGSLWFEVDA